MGLDINIPKPIIDYNDLDNKPNLVTAHSELNLDDGTNPHGTTASDVGALPMPTGTTAEYLRGDGSVATFPTIPDVSGLVPETRTINSHALSSNINISLFHLFCSKNITNTATGGAVRYTGFIDGSGVQTTDIHKIVIPIDTTYFNFYILTGTSQPGTGSSVFTIIKNGVDTGVVITIPAGSGAGVFVDSVNILSVVAGDIISIKWVNNASTTSCRVDSFTMASK